MKKFFGIFLFFLWMAYHTKSIAQSPCGSVTSEVTYPSPQGGSYNVFGVKISITEPYSEAITVSGIISPEGDGTQNGIEWSLTIPQGQTSAETPVNQFQFDPTVMAELHINNVTPCPGNSEFNILSAKYFDSLNVFSESVDRVIGGLTDTQKEQFFTFLDENGVNSTAVAYNLDPENVFEVSQKFNASYFIFCDIARSLYGQIESINSGQLNSLITSLNSYYNSTFLFVGPCEDQREDCVDGALENYENKILGCYGLGISLAPLGFWPGLITGVGCLAYAGYKYNRALKTCERRYNSCL
jgi:hypothetical protein